MSLEKISKDMNILIVDDSSTIQQQVTEQLTGLGFKHFHYANDGEHAFRMMEKLRDTKTNVDLVLLDINMPNMNGIQFLKVARAICKDVPVIMVSAEGDTSTVMDAINAGANQYILKPVTAKKLTDKLVKTFA
jgi:two-component system chemotaxis response regulator CheY